jgi:hypothetical protein
MTGDELMRAGVSVRLPAKKVSEVVYIEPQGRDSRDGMRNPETQ